MSKKRASIINCRFQALYKLAFLLATTTLAAFQLSAQSPEFKVQITKDVLLPGDTVELYATYKIEGRELPPATFAATLVNADSSRIWQMRWPLLKGEADASFVLPKQMPAGSYYLMMAIQPRFLKLFGQVMYPGNLKMIRANFKTKSETHSVVNAVEPNGKFTIEDLFVQGECKVEFVNPESRDPAQTPMVSLDAWLDSTYEPPAYAVKQIIVQSPEKPDELKPGPVNKQAFYASGFGCFSSLFPAVQGLRQYGTLKAIALYDSLYVPPVFKPLATTTFNTFTDTSWKKYRTVFDWLNAKLRNIEVAERPITLLTENSKRGEITTYEPVVQVKFEDYRLWTDNMYGSWDALLRNPAEIAMIKIYEPPFYAFKGKTNLRLGVIAVFDRKYPFVNAAPVRNTYLIKGYTPSYYTLPLSN